MQRVLQVVNIMDRGGVETLLMNIYRNIDREQVQFDFLTHPFSDSANNSQEYEEEIISLGGKVYKAPSYTHNPFSYTKFISRFFQAHPEYTVVHGHNLDAAALSYMRVAKQHGRFLIAHSHNTHDRGSALKGAVLRIVHSVLRRYPDCFYACSNEAAEFAFGKRIASNSCEIVYNGIDVNNYRIDQRLHEELKGELFPGENGPVFINVGRLAEQKNQSFLLDVFAEILANDESALLLLIGKGPMKNILENRLRDLHIGDRVRMLGSVEDVPTYLRAADVFLFPSLYEGLPLAAVEAQAAGLPTLISSSVPSMVQCSDVVRTLDLKSGPRVWSDTALQMYEDNREKRMDCVDQVRDAGFDITTTARKLVTMYTRHT
ncbi:glycosyltransferase [Bifidobacterium italicum]|uniref:Glycosyltransferase n=1 Tax=Bifidobacterium italicum TaxID=1960968 RepID=A0A2A2EN79_9BIFI|nr:glycosyltransferase [Bifidobacterium italicum]PAU70258.1 glycosyltransferase [Bifidobacterium italicum]